MAFTDYREFVSVSSTKLTLPGSKVEKALRAFQKDVRVKAAYFTTGHVDVLPELRVCVGQQGGLNRLFHHPYDDVEELYKSAEQSQVGTIKKTLFRLDARKSREFSKVEELNQSWKDQVLSVCEQIRHNLAPAASKVTATLYKLLLYQKGDFFRKHQDAQHSTYMFATLLFFLPICHNGGEFELCEPRSYTVSYEAPKSSAGCPWVAFYTDINHTVNEVTDGYRVALNYSLCFEGSMCPSPMFPSLRPLAVSAIADYFASERKALAIPLAYEYTVATLSAKFLKGIDSYLYSAIEQVASICLQFVMDFRKTKVTLRTEEHDHNSMFQDIFVVSRDKVKQFFDIKSESDRQLERIQHLHGNEHYRKASEIEKKRDSNFNDLMKRKVMHVPGVLDLEWIIQRDDEGNPIKSTRGYLDFTVGELGWLGNMTPPEEYYYLKAAMIVKKKC